MNIKQAARDSIIILFISLALLVCSEIALRIIFPEEIEVSGNAPSPEMLAYQFNPDYLIALKPGVHKTYTRLRQNGGNTIHWQTNSDGFRGPALHSDPETRIMVYGDSNIQARFSTDKNTFVRQLERLLNQQGFSGTEVINAGTVGFGPDQNLIKFSKEVDIYHPDMVIFNILADNDFGDIIRNRLFELNESGELKATHLPKTLDSQLQRNKSSGKNSFISTLLVFKAARKVIRSITINTSHEYFQIMQHAASHEYAIYKASQPRKFSNFGDHYDIDIALHPKQESSTTKVRLMSAVLSKAKELADNKGVAFMVLIEPSVIDLTETNSALSYQYLQQFPSYQRNRLTEIVRKICLDKKIHALDLFGPFLKNHPEKLYFFANDHWNDAGQALAAKETASYIISNALIAGQATQSNHQPH